MADSNDKNVKRYGRHNKKEQLQRPESVFPSEAETEFDIDSLSLPDTDSEALESLAALSDEVKAPHITPQGERFPPLAPTTPTQASSQSSEKLTSSRSKANHNTLYNVLTVLILIATVAFIIWALIIWNNPQSDLNPLPPATPFVVITATPGAAIQGINATADASGQIFVVITDTPAGLSAANPFTAQISYIANNNEMGCNWSSIAGAVSDIQGNGLGGYRIHISGNGLNETIFSGTADTFGAGGFEFPLLDITPESNFIVQLFNPQNIQLSEAISVSPHAECDANVVFINFVGNP